MNATFRLLTVFVLYLFIAGVASAQPYAQPQGPPPPVYVPYGYYQPPMMIYPTWHSGPFGILWWQRWHAVPVQPVPAQPYPGQPAPSYQQPMPAPQQGQVPQ